MRVFKSKTGSLLLLLIGVLALGIKRGECLPQNVQYISAVGPVASTTTVTINNPGTGIRTCLTNISVVSDSNSTFRMLSQATTTYTMTLSSNTPHVNPFGVDDPWCSGTASTTTLKVDTGSFTINYHGYKF